VTARRTELYTGVMICAYGLGSREEPQSRTGAVRLPDRERTSWPQPPRSLSLLHREEGYRSQETRDSAQRCLDRLLDTLSRRVIRPPAPAPAPARAAVPAVRPAIVPAA